MGPRARYVGAEVPAEELIWQDPVPAVDHELIDASDVAALKSEILESGLTVPELVRTAWASAASFRGTDMRGGPTGHGSGSRRRRTGKPTIRTIWPRCWSAWRAFRRISMPRNRAARRFHSPI